jgi:hypothetical protein
MLGVAMMLDHMTRFALFQVQSPLSFAANHLDLPNLFQHGDGVDLGV